MGPAAHMMGMTTTSPSPTAEAARENARTAGGQFGTQPKSESQVELETKPPVDFDEAFPEPATAARAKETFQEVESFTSGDGYLGHALEFNDEAMFGWSGPDTVHYASRDGGLRVAVEPLGEDQFAVEMVNEETGARRDESYGASEAARLATDLSVFWNRDGE